MKLPGWIKNWIVDDDPDQNATSRLDELDGVTEHAAVDPVDLWLRDALVWAASPIEMSTRQWVRCLPPVPTLCPHWLTLRLQGVIHDAMTPAEVLAVAMPEVRR